MRVVRKADVVCVELLHVRDRRVNRRLVRGLAHRQVVLVNADALEIQGLSVENDGPAFDADLPEPDPVAHAVIPAFELEAVEPGRVGRPQLRPGADAGAARPVEHRHGDIDVQVGDPQAGAGRARTEHAEIERNSPKTAVGNEAEEPVADENRRGSQEEHVPIDAPVVEPVGILRGHAVAPPPRLHDDDDPVLRPCDPGDLRAEWRGAPVVRPEAGAVEKHGRPVLGTLEAEEGSLPCRAREAPECPRVDPRAFEVAQLIALHVPARRDGHGLPGFPIVVQGKGAALRVAAVLEEPARSQTGIVPVDAEAPLAIQRFCLPARRIDEAPAVERHRTVVRGIVLVVYLRLVVGAFSPHALSRAPVRQRRARAQGIVFSASFARATTLASRSASFVSSILL